jgi:hypothetical protein
MYNDWNDHRSRVLLWTLLLVFASPVQAASVNASSAVVYDEGFFEGSTTIPGVPINSAGSSASTVGYSSSVVPGLAASGHAQALFGALHATAFSAAANPGVGATSQTRGLGGATWADQLTISSATSSGAAFARATFSLSGGLNSLSEAASTGNSTMAAEVRINGALVFSTTAQLVSSGGAITVNDIRRGQALNGVFQIDPATDLTGDFSFDIPFVFGVPFLMSGSLTAFTQALSGAAGAEASASSNFGSSGLWGGISGVHLADGTALGGYSLGSDSGFDWNNAFPAVAVPEPSTYAMLLAGLVFVGFAARRKRQ